MILPKLERCKRGPHMIADRYSAEALETVALWSVHRFLGWSENAMSPWPTFVETLTTLLRRFQYRCEEPNGLVDAAFFQRSVAKHECRGTGVGFRAVNARTAQTHRLPSGRFYDLSFVRISAHLDHYVKSRRYTPRSQMRQMNSQRIHE